MTAMDPPGRRHCGKNMLSRSRAVSTVVRSVSQGLAGARFGASHAGDSSKWAWGAAAAAALLGGSALATDTVDCEGATAPSPRSRMSQEEVSLAMDSMKIFSGNSNPELAEAIAAHVGKPLGNITVGRFADGEVSVSVHENGESSVLRVSSSTPHLDWFSPPPREPRAPSPAGRCFDVCALLQCEARTCTSSSRPVLRT
jgi:hypothetical protein